VWEYKVVKLSTAEQLEDTLNRYAADGWRCKFQYVVAGFGSTSLIVTLEREVDSV
jgi:hypothetical protein